MGHLGTREPDRPTAFCYLFRMSGKPAWMAIVACVSGVIFSVCASTGALAATSSPSGAAKQAYVKAVHTDDPQSSAASASSLVNTGLAICVGLKAGEPVNTIAKQLGKSVDGKSLPGAFIAAVVVESSRHLCPKYFPEVKKAISADNG
jgi:hypothetical protein